MFLPAFYNLDTRGRLTRAVLHDRGRRDPLSIATGLGHLEFNTMQGDIPEALMEPQIDEASHSSGS